MTRSPAPPASRPAAVAAFLRGVHRRSRLLARVQAGDPGAARDALSVAAKVFAADAGQWPIAEWPAQYWRLLLSVPAMGLRRAEADAAPILPQIARLTPSLRAAVLLHLVAGLEDGDAAAALGIGVGLYQQRIRSALPRTPQGELDLDVWRAWRDAAQQALEQLPDAVEPTSAAPRAPQPRPAAAAAFERDTAADAAAVGAAPRAQRRRMRWLWLALLACALALVATFFVHPRGRALIDAWRHRVTVEALPSAAPPKARFDPGDARLDPDRALRAAPQELALARRLPLLAWLVASHPWPDADVHAGAATAPAEPMPEAAPWRPATPAQRGRDRGAWAEWQQLTDPERAALRAAAARFDALPEPQQRSLLTRYAQLPFDAHRGWHLGPVLGPDWPRIAALFAFVAPQERGPLLAMLRSASPADIDALARLAQSTPPQARAALRKALLAQPVAQRGAWLQARAGA